VTTTQMVPRLAIAFGTEAHETSVGFKFVGPKMREVGAIIGGEESGGFGFGFHIPERDGLLAALLLLEMRAQRRVSFDRLLADLQAQYGPSEYSRVDVHFAREGYEAVMRSVLDDIDKRISSTLASERVDHINRLGDNGFKAYLADGSWLLLRFSGTEPALRIYAEGPTKARVAELLEEGRVLAS
jgi:phosphomannomutase